MCGPEVPWDWLILDVSYVMVLVGGGMVLRARGATPVTWLAFGLLSTAVGGGLFAITSAAYAPADTAQASAALQAMQACL